MSRTRTRTRSHAHSGTRTSRGLILTGEESWIATQAEIFVRILRDEGFPRADECTRTQIIDDLCTGIAASLHAKAATATNHIGTGVTVRDVESAYARASADALNRALLFLGGKTRVSLMRIRDDLTIISMDNADLTMGRE